jgi:hypothetical protein
MPISEITCHGCGVFAVQVANATVPHAENRSMNKLRVVTIGFVFNDQFPIRMGSVL